MSGSLGGSAKTDYQGRPLMLRDGRLAAINFTLRDTRFTGVPKPKFLFYVRFIRGSPQGQNDNLQWGNGVGFVLKYIDRPTIDFELQTLNQYNKKRIVQTKVEYQPLTMKFHDTVDNKIFKVFEDYFKFYYGDAVNVDNTAWNYDVTTGTFLDGANGWGFSPPLNMPNLTYYFSHIEIYQVYGGKFNQFDIIHPKISSFDPDELDFSNLGSPGEITMKVAYEGIIFRQNGASLESKPGLVEEMGLNVSGFYENFDGPVADSALQQAGVGQVRPEQFDANNIFRDFTNRSINDVANDLISGNSVNLGNIFKGNFQNAVLAGVNQTGGFGNNLIRQAFNQSPNGGVNLGNLGRSFGYNLLNTGTTTGFSDVDGNINPTQRGLGLLRGR